MAGKGGVRFEEVFMRGTAYHLGLIVILGYDSMYRVEIKGTVLRMIFII